MTQITNLTRVAYDKLKTGGRSQPAPEKVVFDTLTLPDVMDPPQPEITLITRVDLEFCERLSIDSTSLFTSTIAVVGELAHWAI